MRQRYWSVATACYSLIVVFVVVSAWSCAPQPQGIEGSIEFKLKTSKKSKKGTKKSSSGAVARPKDAPQLFTPADGHKVEARVTLTGLEPGKDEVVHLVWLRPDGKELFRKVKDFVPEGPTESFKSSMNISPEREREPGKYAFKVYRHRRLLATGIFEIGEPTEAAETEEEESVGS